MIARDRVVENGQPNLDMRKRIWRRNCVRRAKRKISEVTKNKWEVKGEAAIQLSRIAR